MKYWQIEQNKDIKINESLKSISSFDILSTIDENNLIKEIESANSNTSKLKLICKNTLDSQKNVRVFILEGLTEYGKEIVQILFKNHSQIVGKTMADFRNMDIISE